MNKTKTLALAVTATMALGGCASNEPMDDQTRTKVEGSAIGALVGAAIGAAVNGRDGTLVGAAIGGGAGYLIGNEIAKRKAKYASEEDFLDGEIQYVAEYNRNAANYNAKLAAEVKRLEKTANSLVARYRQGKADQAALAAQRNKVRKQLKKSRQMLADLEQEYKLNQQVLEEQRKRTGAADPDVKRLEREVAELKRNIEKLQRSTDQLARIDERLSV